MLALRLLWRNWRSGELKLLSAAVILAVAVVGAIAVFTDRLERTLMQQSNTLLGADLVVRSSQPFDSDWFLEAERAGVEHTQVVTFASMIYADDNMFLASVKAVAEGYPLRGQLDISDQAFVTDAGLVREAAGIPAPGEAWVDSRLLPLLDIALGADVGVGEYDLKVTQVLVREPDSSNPFSMMGPRLLMNLADLTLTQVVQPGSRVTYQWLLASDNDVRLQRFVDWLSPRLSDHERIVGVEAAQGGVADTLETGQRFLLLAAVIGVLLAGVAIAISARQFAERHEDQVALMKSLGASANRVRLLYLVQLLALAAGASLIGLVLAELLQHLVARGLSALYAIDLRPATPLPYLLSFTTGILCLVFFAFPSLWFLPAVAPLRVLRRELVASRVQSWVQLACAALAVLVLVGLFSRDLALAVSMVAALLLVLLVTLLLASGLLRLSRTLGGGAGIFWRLAVASLQRRRAQSLMQIAVFAVAFMLLFTLLVVRNSLVDEWQMRVPEQAPNHFLVNIPSRHVTAIQELMDARGLAREPLYPMVRGRLAQINGQEPRDHAQSDHNVLRREVNLTWTAELAEDNVILDGDWWDSWQPDEAGLPGVSVELDAATELRLSVGDRVRFSIGGLPLEAQVASIRSLDWNSMRPNFYFIFSPGTLEDYSPTYITSVYLSSEQKLFINELLRAYPTVLVMELDRIIDQIRTIVRQVSNGVQLVLWLTLVGGVMVLLAAVNSSLSARRQESGLLRALGSSRRLILSSVWSEFSILGFLAGLIAVLGSELLLLSLQRWVLNTPIQPHYWMWLLGPVVGASLVGGLGLMSCRSVVTTPPGVVLRSV